MGNHFRRLHQHDEPQEPAPKIYTQQEYEEYGENCFNAAKDRHWKDQTGEIVLYDGDRLPYYPEKYKTVQSYLLSKKANSKQQ